MIGIAIKFIAGLLLRRARARGNGLTERRATEFARIIAWAIVALLCIAALLALDWWDDRRAIKAHEAERVAAALEAERRANAAAEVRDQARQAASAQTSSELETIHAQDPHAAAAPAAPGSRAVARRLPAH